MNYLIIIPARFSSKRFPGKPLAKINGKEMISYVWNTCISSVPKKNVIVATDSIKIKKFCEINNINVIMTSKNCLTGTDRVYEVSKKIKKDIYINVQGDEPLIQKKDILKFLDFVKKNKKTVINAYTKINNSKDYFNVNIPKVVFDNSNNLLFMSRSNIPGNKKNKFIEAFKQVCIYSFPYKQLNIFGKIKKKSILEKIEDIEILRYLELGIKVKMIELSNSSIGVDTLSDLKKVEKIIKNEKI